MDETSRQTLAGYVPVIASMPGALSTDHGKTMAYVCENFTCKLPVDDPAKFAELIQ